MAEYQSASRAALAPFEPTRDESFFTEAGQAALIATVLSEAAAGRSHAFVITDDLGAFVGRISINSVVRGALQSASIGYGVRPDRQGEGWATSAVAAVIDFAFTDLRLHRLEASTLVDNRASQIVLARNGFTEFGLAPQYLQIAGAWQDCRLFGLINTAWR